MTDSLILFIELPRLGTPRYLLLRTSHFLQVHNTYMHVPLPIYRRESLYRSGDRKARSYVVLGASGVD